MSKLRYRSSIVEHLQCVRSLSAFGGPDELISGWFDDLYVPAMFAKNPTGSAQQTQLAEFKALFSPTELEALSDFNQVFSEAFPALSRNPAEFQRDLGWQTVANRAREALKAFGV